MSWKKDWKRDLAQRIKAIVILALLAVGIVLLWTYGKYFMIAVKPGYSMDYVMANGVKKGMHISGEVNFLYDSFAQLENTATQKVTAYYYAIPVMEGMVALYVPPEKNALAEQIMQETLNYLETGVWPVTSMPIEGYVVEAEGRIPYLLTTYMAEIGFSEEEIAAMGAPLMIQEATTTLANARIYAPVGMICLTLGILTVMFMLFRGRFRNS